MREPCRFAEKFGVEYTVERKHNVKRDATEGGCEGSRGRDGGKETLILSFVAILVKLD
jgi:hypothetical protein